jgi:DMSO/TMAO reductase YedYZ molybdopterin-dependent catalytic subunit
MFEQVQRRKREEEAMKQAGRLPPGQSLTLDFPVLQYGPVVTVDVAKWSLRVFGEVEQEMRWNWDEFRALPTVTLRTDLHCVTRWSKFDTTWEGVRFRDFCALFGVKPAARHVIAHCVGGYTTNMELDKMMDDDVLLAYRYEGEYLTAEHGYPLRTLVPKRYLWKSAKWLTALEFSRTDKPGFWEQNGYHNQGDPFREERYSRGGWFF